MRNNKELEEANKSLIEENSLMKETINKLETLDMELEKKRKSFK